MFEFSGDTSALFENYRNSPNFFPIIGAVLEGIQDGKIYANDPLAPSSWFVVHSFNFAQFIELEHDPDFNEDIANQLFLSGNPCKYRIYDVSPRWSSTLHSMDKDIRVQYGTRERFLFEGTQKQADDGLTHVLDTDKFDQIDELFELGLDNRFWRNRQEALTGAHAVYVADPDPVSICYGAALSNGIIEIDVLTQESARRKGYGKVAVDGFINHCIDEGLTAAWDCYSNNTASFELARSIGFTHKLVYDSFVLGC